MLLRYAAAVAGHAPAITSSPSDSVMANVMQTQRNPSAEAIPAVAGATAAAAASSSAMAAAAVATVTRTVASSHSLMAHSSVDPPFSLSAAVHSGTHASPDSFPSYAHAMLPSFATSSSPFPSSMVQSSSWNTFPPNWTHPSLLTSPILYSTNYHSAQTCDYNGGSAGGAGIGAVGHTHGGGHASGLMEEEYMDFCQ